MLQRNSSIFASKIFNKLLIFAETNVMDTTEISQTTYKAIIETAALAHKDLALQFGMLAKLSKNEADYIQKSGQLIDLMLGYNEEEVDAIFIENPLSMSEFKTVLKMIGDNISGL